MEKKGAPHPNSNKEKLRRKIERMRNQRSGSLSQHVKKPTRKTKKSIMDVLSTMSEEERSKILPYLSEKHKSNLVTFQAKEKKNNNKFIDDDYINRKRPKIKSVVSDFQK